MKIAKYSFVLGFACWVSAVLAFDLQGHRGARGLMPENTLPGFATALAIGVNTLELDLAVTRDLEVVVMHNPRFEPWIAKHSNGDWLQKSSPSIHSMTLETVKTYDVGHLNPTRKYASSFPLQKAIDGTVVPTLGEVFELVNKSGNHVVKFNVEIKTDPQKPELTFPPEKFVRAVIDVIHDYKMTSRVSVQSFDWRALQIVQKLDPDITTTYLSVNQRWFNNLQIGKPGPSPWLNGIDIDNFEASPARAIQSAGGDIWSPFHTEVDSESIEWAAE